MEKNISRLTVDLPTEIHKRLKARAALRGISIKEYITDFITHDEEHDAWMFKSVNKDLVERIQEGINKDERHDLGSFAQYAEEE